MKDNEHPWFSEEAGFFGPIYLEHYAKDLPPERTVQEVAFIEKALALAPGMKILDMPCGHGRHSIELAKRGYNVTGVDLNGFFLQTAKDAAAKEGVTVNLLQGDMRKLSFDEEFDVTLNLFTGIGYFEDDAEDQAVLNVVAGSLRSGGRFLIDFLNYARLMGAFVPKDWHKLSDGSTLLTEREHHLLTGKSTERRTTVRNGMESIVECSVRCYTTVELIRMTVAAGLRFKEGFGDFEGNKLTKDAKRVVLVFEKP